MRTAAKLTGMIIDDQAVMRSIIKGALKKLGIQQILEANSGNNALETLRRGPNLPDFIFCDLYMEDGGGTEFINQMRRDEHLRTLNIPILLLTGESDEMLLDVCRQLGAVTVLPKPCSLPQIAEALSKIVGFNLTQIAV